MIMMMTIVNYSRWFKMVIFRRRVTLKHFQINLNYFRNRVGFPKKLFKFILFLCLIYYIILSFLRLVKKLKK